MKFVLTLLLAAVATQAQPLRRAPGFSLPDLDYKQYDLGDYRGKVVVLDIIQTNCPKCIELTKQLADIKTKYADRVQVLSIVTMPDNAGTVSKFISAYNIKSPVLLDCGQVIGSYLQLTPKNPTVHFPHVYVIDKLGMIRRDISENELAPAALVGAIESALK